MASKLTKNPIHLGLGGTALELPEFTGDMSWYEVTANAPHPMGKREGLSPSTVFPNAGTCGKCIRLAAKWCSVWKVKSR